MSDRDTMNIIQNNRSVIKLNFSTPSNSFGNQKDAFVFNGGLLNHLQQKTQKNEDIQSNLPPVDQSELKLIDQENLIKLCLEHKSKAIYVCEEEDACSVKNKTGCHKCINIYHYNHKVRMLDDNSEKDNEQLKMQKQMTQVKQQFLRFQNIIKAPEQSEGTFQGVNESNNNKKGQKVLEKQTLVNEQSKINQIQEEKTQKDHFNKVTSQDENNRNSCVNQMKHIKNQIPKTRQSESNYIQTSSYTGQKLIHQDLKQISTDSGIKQIIHESPLQIGKSSLPIDVSPNIQNTSQNLFGQNEQLANQLNIRNSLNVTSQLGNQLQNPQLNLQNLTLCNQQQFAMSPCNNTQLQQPFEQNNQQLCYTPQYVPIVAYFPQQYPQNYVINMQQNSSAQFPQMQVFCQNPFVIMQQHPNNNQLSNLINFHNYPQNSNIPSQIFTQPLQPNQNQMQNQNFNSVNGHMFDLTNAKCLQKEQDPTHNQPNQYISNTAQILGIQQQIASDYQLQQNSTQQSNLIVNNHNSKINSFTSHSVSCVQDQSNISNHLTQQNYQILNNSNTVNTQISPLLQGLPVSSSPIIQSVKQLISPQSQQEHQTSSQLQQIVPKIELSERTTPSENDMQVSTVMKKSEKRQDQSRQGQDESCSLTFKLKQEQIDDCQLSNKQINNQNASLSLTQSPKDQQKSTDSVECFRVPTNEKPRMMQQLSIIPSIEARRSTSSNNYSEQQVKQECFPFMRSYGNSFGSSPCSANSNKQRVNVQYFIENKCMKSQYTSLDKVIHQHIDFYPSIAFLNAERIIQISLNTFEMKYYLNLVDIKSKKILQRQEVSYFFQTQKRSLQFDENKRIIVQKINNEISALYERGENFIDIISNASLKVVRRVKQYSIQKIISYNKGRGLAVASLSGQVTLYNINCNKFSIINQFNVRNVKPIYTEVTQTINQNQSVLEQAEDIEEEEQEEQEVQDNNNHSNKFTFLLSCDIFIQGNKLLWCGSSLFKFTYCIIDIASSARMILEPTQASYPNGIVNNDYYKIQISNVQIFNDRVYFEFNHIDKSSDHFQSNINSSNSLQFSKYNVIQYKLEQTEQESKLVLHSQHLNSNIIKVSDPKNQVFLYSQQKAHIIGIQLQKQDKPQLDEEQQNRSKTIVINNVAYLSTLFNRQAKQEVEEIKFKMNISQFQNSQTLYVYLTKSQNKQQQNKNEQFITLVDNKKIFHKVFLSQAQYTTKIN